MLSSPYPERASTATDVSFGANRLNRTLHKIDDIVAQAVTRGSLHLLAIYSEFMISFDKGTTCTSGHIAFGSWSILRTHGKLFHFDKA